MAVIDQQISDRYALYNADAMEVLTSLKSQSVGLSIYSLPFPETYCYSNDPRDLANCATYEEGLEQYQFVADEVARLLMRGRMACVHCMDLKKGSFYQRDFPGDIVRCHEKAGMHFFCRITIWKDPWLIARRTKMRSLMHKSLVADSASVRVAGPDYVLVFKSPGENQSPIEHPGGLKTYAGEIPVPEELIEQFYHYSAEDDQRKNKLSHWIFRQYASPVWMDIRGGRLLPYQEARESDEEKHVCALQLDVIERCLVLWSNPGDVVLTPFAGVGSEVYAALRNGRRAVGVELKSTYYRQAKKNIAAALTESPQEAMLPFEIQDESELDAPPDESEPEAHVEPPPPGKRKRKVKP